MLLVEHSGGDFRAAQIDTENIGRVRHSQPSKLQRTFHPIGVRLGPGGDYGRAVVLAGGELPAGRAVSPDGESLLFSRFDVFNDDIVLVEGFR